MSDNKSETATSTKPVREVRDIDPDVNLFFKENYFNVNETITGK
jgi:hypothetical protein